MMHPRLAEILEAKKDEVTRLKKHGPVFYDDDLPPPRDFKGAISKPGKINLITEIKFASPSAGLICEKTDPISIGRIYKEEGASAISLLTDKLFFHGELKQLPRLKKAVSLPILRKDFIIDEIQVKESSQYGADAILLIARILPYAQLRDLLEASKNLGISALVEIHDRQDLENALKCDAEIIGINNRDLDSFEVNLNTTLELAPLVPDDCVLISESGIHNRGDIKSLKGTGIRAVLVGSAIMQSKEMAKKTGELVDAGCGM